jgi:hypothetical protein
MALAFMMRIIIHCGSYEVVADGIVLDEMYLRYLPRSFDTVKDSPLMRHSSRSSQRHDKEHTVHPPILFSISIIRSLLKASFTVV